jgi:chemotaxis methyl-accepting protein methylase
MICYKDRSWCVSYIDGTCVNKACDRFFSNEEQQKAIKWWSTFCSPGEEVNYPISVAVFKTEECGYNTSTEGNI